MRWLARHRAWTLIVVAAVVAIGLSAWLGRHDHSHGGALDPQNPDGDGAQALARVLSGQGVDVEVVRSADAFDQTPVDDSTTVLVTGSDHLGRSTTGRLLDHVGHSELVVVAPDPALTRQLDVGGYGVDTSPSGPVAAACPPYDGLSLRVEKAEAFETDGCFPTRGGVLIAEPRPGLTLLGAPAALTNDQILEGDNAAVALRLLGGRRHLVWYVPSLADLRGGDGVAPSTLLPRWLSPALWLLLVTGLALVVWRARRLGPLAVEPLPVQVKAVETTRNLGRLYRRAADRPHAAAALRQAARTRLADRLALSSRIDHHTLAAAVSADTGREVGVVSALLDPQAPPPTTDRELADLARQLAELDREVSHA